MFYDRNQPFQQCATVVIGWINVSLKESITFLGSVLGDGKGSGHCDSRVRNATRSFYALQGAGIKYPGVSPVISVELYRSVVRSVLEYGTTSLYINKSNINRLDKLQNRADVIETLAKLLLRGDLLGVSSLSKVQCEV